MLRECKQCSLKASTEEDLELFKFNKSSKHSRENICKLCNRALGLLGDTRNDVVKLLRYFDG